MVNVERQSRTLSCSCPLQHLQVAIRVAKCGDGASADLCMYSYRLAVLVVIENLVHLLRNGHIYAFFLCYIMDGLGGLNTFSHHIHFHHRTFYTVSFADHIAKHAVSAKCRIACNE